MTFNPWRILLAFLSLIATGSHAAPPRHVWVQHVDSMTNCPRCEIVRRKLANMGQPITHAYTPRKRAEVYPMVYYSHGQPDNGERLLAGECTPTSAPVLMLEWRTK